MYLKNYTSSVPVISSISKIENRLAQAGATHIAKSYENEKPTGMIFQIPSNNIPLTFQLPAKVKKVYDYMAKSKSRIFVKSVKEATMLQAEKTAWKLLSDWIDIQVSMILLDQVEAPEVFLPYLYDGKSNRTLYEMAKASNFKLLNQ